MYLIFKWNTEKAKRNLKKQGLSFNEAATVFSDSLSITYDDPDHSYGDGICDKPSRLWGRWQDATHTEC